MRKLILILALLVGCGQPVEINYHYNTSLEQIHAMGGADAVAYTTWESKYDANDFLNHNSGHEQCDIYLLPRNTWPWLSNDCFWSAIIEHEKRHCYEHNFSPDTMDFSQCQSAPN